MKVLLMSDIHPLGMVGDVVDVKPGYARNYLLPQQLACHPTPANLKKVEQRRKEIEAKRARELAEKKDLAKRLDGREVTIVARANELGHLFGSVGPKEIADALAKDGYNIDPKWVLLDEPIKQLDKRTVSIQLAPDIEGRIELWIVPEKTDDQAEITDDEQPGDE